MYKLTSENQIFNNRTYIMDTINIFYLYDCISCDLMLGSKCFGKHKRKDGSYGLSSKCTKCGQKKCKHIGCDITPSFGKRGGTRKDALYCDTHKPVDYVDIVNKKCKHEGCNIIPIYGKRDGTNKNSLYCNTHKPVDYVNVVNKKCKHEECNTRPTYGELFKDIIHCNTHKKPNEYKENKPICENIKCDNPAYYTDTKENYPKRCEEHMEENDSNIIEKKCCKCGLLYFLNKDGLCNDCNIFFNHNVNKRKEHIVRDRLRLKYLKKWVSHDKIPSGSCYKYRPDFVYDFGTHICILSVDENQHKTYECVCEQARMINITQDFGGIPVIWLRFNPDRYVDNQGKKHHNNINGRIPMLIKTLKSVEIHKPKSLCSAYQSVYLFYDGFDIKNINIEKVNLDMLNI